MKTRDYLMVLLINGATKAGVVPNKKRLASKRKCRKKVRKEDE